jgi:hypothetical protein
LADLQTKIQTSFNVWYSEAQSAYDILIDDVRNMIAKMRAEGIADKQIVTILKDRMGNTVEEFRTFKGWVEGATDKMIYSASQDESNDYEQEQKLTWVLDPSVTEHCDTCLEREGYEPMTFAEWEAIGLPGAGTTDCDGYCKCTLTEVA